MFSKPEQQYYARHFTLPRFGKEGQQRLKRARVLVIGAGGLGCPLLQYLTAAGIGQIGILDDDIVSTSNLHRQVLYGLPDVGRLKAEAARDRLQSLNPHVEIQAFPERFTIENAMDRIADWDIVVDGTDNFPTRYLVNDACVLAGKVNVFGAVFRYEGQVSVFNLPDADGSRGVNYRDLHPNPPAPGSVPSCAEGGVLGVLPGIIGSLQANEVIKVAAKVGETLSGRMLFFDAETGSTRLWRLRKDPSNHIDRLEIPAGYCTSDIKELSPQELGNWQAAVPDLLLLDVRQPQERQQEHLGGLFIPLDQLEEKLDQIPRNQKVVVYCQSGIRSVQAIRLLHARLGLNDLWNLSGGLNAWKKMSSFVP